METQYITKFGPIYRINTQCCALRQLSLGNNVSTEDIKGVIELIKKESNKEWHTSNPYGGERALFVIVTMPYEEILAEKLKEVGFNKIAQFERRNGYPLGYNEMWFISW